MTLGPLPVSLATAMLEPPQSTRPLRVLIVDDQSFARRALAALLSLQEGLEIVGEAANGNEAIELAGRHSPHVVVMDIEMPVMDGMEATRRITRAWPHIRVVIFSMHDEWRERALKKGAHAFLVKGESPDRLLAVLSQLHGELSAND
jgi:two-component system response regulator DesR